VLATCGIRSSATSAIPKISAETIALIKAMASNNRLWGAERIRGELLKLDLHVCKRANQKYMRSVRATRPRARSRAACIVTIDVVLKFCQIAEEVIDSGQRRGPPSMHHYAVAGHFRRSMDQARHMDAFWHWSLRLQEQGSAPYFDFIRI
jgi:hypothetical protein